MALLDGIEGSGCHVAGRLLLVVAVLENSAGARPSRTVSVGTLFMLSSNMSI